MLCISFSVIKSAPVVRSIPVPLESIHSASLTRLDFHHFQLLVPFTLISRFLSSPPLAPRPDSTDHYSIFFCLTPSPSTLPRAPLDCRGDGPAIIPFSYPLVILEIHCTYLYSRHPTCVSSRFNRRFAPPHPFRVPGMLTDHGSSCL